MPLTWKQKRLLLKFFVPSIKAHKDWPVIISEGDSWFSFPIHPNIIDNLDEMANRKISLLRLEKNGDKALRIIGGKQKDKLAKYLKRFPVNALLFSGGGNDIVGEDLRGLLKEKKPGMNWEDCIHKTAAKCRIEGIRGAYLELIQLRNENRPDCQIYVHTYDLAIPSGRGIKVWKIKIGPWMKPYLEERNIKDEDDQRRIIHWLLARFREMILEVAEQPNVVLVDTQGTLTENEWNDEIHPTRPGFKKIATKFREQLKVQFPTTF